MIHVIGYTSCLENIVYVPKKDGKTQVCVGYQDLNKAIPNITFPYPTLSFLLLTMPNPRFNLL